MHASYRRVAVASVATAGILLTAAPAARAQAFADIRNATVNYSVGESDPRIACEMLTASIKDKDIVSLQARAIPPADNAPAHCRVSGILSTEIGFEVNLPAKWNRRIYMIGNGGLAGEQPDDAGRAAQRAAALAHLFVMVSTDTGHNATKEPAGVFAQRNPPAALDYAYRAVHATAMMAKRIANAYYDKPVSHSYWNSCSNGGRQGLLEAQRFPDDFDGIVANAP